VIELTRFAGNKVQKIVEERFGFITRAIGTGRM